MKPKAIRKALGLKQSEFASLFDVHPMTISKWERGEAEPSPYQMALMKRFTLRFQNVRHELAQYGAVSTLCYLLS